MLDGETADVIILSRPVMDDAPHSKIRLTANSFAQC
jgi:hypothetical protein